MTLHHSNQTNSKNLVPHGKVLCKRRRKVGPFGRHLRRAVRCTHGSIHLHERLVQPHSAHKPRPRTSHEGPTPCSNLRWQEVNSPWTEPPRFVGWAFLSVVRPIVSDPLAQQQPRIGHTTGMHSRRSESSTARYYYIRRSEGISGCSEGLTDALAVDDGGTELQRLLPAGQVGRPGTGAARERGVGLHTCMQQQRRRRRRRGDGSGEKDTATCAA